MSAAVMVGAGQVTSRRGAESSPPSPLDLTVTAATAALEDAGGTAVADQVDTVAAIPDRAWLTPDSALEVAAALGITPARTIRTNSGGDIGVVALNWAAEEIGAGRSRGVLLVSSHTQCSVDLARRRGETLRWAGGTDHQPEEIGGEHLDGSSPEENEAGLDRPIYLYPVIENARRAARGLTIAEHRAEMGRLFTRFTEVAAANPHAWFPTARSAEELTTVTPTNRMISFPYPKYLNAVISTDQAAAVLILSAEAARAAGIGGDGWVHWWGGGKASELAWFVSTRPDISTSAALGRAHGAALGNAGVSIDEVARMDFYSCFPGPVEIALEAHGLTLDDPRGFTVTGGLPYAGGPGSSYTLHSLAAMFQLLRANPGEIGLVGGNGWYATKHSATVLSTTPPRAEHPTAATPELSPADTARLAPVPLRRGSEPGRVVSYTVAHDHDGAPQRGMVVGAFADGSRFVATTPDDPAGLAAMEAEEFIGRTGAVLDKGPGPLQFVAD